MIGPAMAIDQGLFNALGFPHGDEQEVDSRPDEKTAVASAIRSQPFLLFPAGLTGL